MDTIKLSIVTPNGEIFSGDVKSVVLPGKDGEFGVLPGHVSLLASLQVGVIEIEKQDSKEAVAINWGYAKVNEKEVNVLVDEAVSLTSGDIAKNIEQANKLVESVQDSNNALASVKSKINSFA